MKYESDSRAARKGDVEAPKEKFKELKDDFTAKQGERVHFRPNLAAAVKYNEDCTKNKQLN